MGFASLIEALFIMSSCLKGFGPTNPSELNGCDMLSEYCNQ